MKEDSVRSVRSGMNTFQCHCKDGTIHLPITMDRIAELRVFGPKKAKGKCTNGHDVNIMVTAHFRPMA